jgi:hypothetical protein
MRESNSNLKLFASISGSNLFCLLSLIRVIRGSFELINYREASHCRNAS